MAFVDGLYCMETKKKMELNMKAVILAAGRGSRLGKYTDDKPKCLIEIGGETLLDRELRLLSELGIKAQDVFRCSRLSAWPTRKQTLQYPYQQRMER